MAMSDAHKKALAEGRRQSAAIKRYLDALGSRRPGRPVTPDSIEKRIDGLKQKISAEKDPLKRVELVQQRMDLEDALKSATAAGDLVRLEADFVAHAAAYSERKGITYSAWREGGVSADVLKEAGIRRTRRG
ncbi:MAG: hypothetical protein HKO87_01765 [Acidimicrobiia bacterium]|nr:hypothetical protein [Acidimicrobiia bacterium]